MNRPQPNRKNMPNDFKLISRDDIKPFYDKFLSQNISSLNELEEFIFSVDEIDKYMGEEYAVRYIANSCNTTDEGIKASYMSFVTEIIPEWTKSNNEINKKIVANQQLVDELIAKDPRFAISMRNLKNDLSMYREENIPLNTQDSELSDKYGEITSQQTVSFDGQENMPLNKLAGYFENPDESIRKSARELYRSRKMQDNDSMLDILSQMVPIRQQMAHNAGFENFVTYMFQSKNRFDYTQTDVDNFHHTAETVIKPIVANIYHQKAKLMGKEKLKPRDLKFDPLGDKALKPYNNSKELVDKTVEILGGLDVVFGQNLQYMYDNGLMDLDSRPGKQNGGYNYPLQETGAAFIFMNNNNTQRDLETMVHEAGHAMHGFVMRDNGLDNSGLTGYPSELAEVASMSMELFTAESRDKFYPDHQEYIRSRIIHLEGIVGTLCSIAAIDKMQKDIYSRDIVGPDLNSLAGDIFMQYKYDSSIIDRSGYENYQKIERQRVLHIYEVPFYYIEYGIAQLGAIAMRKNYLENPAQGIINYKNFLACGNTKTIPETFAAGGIKFDMSSEYISDLMNFVGQKLEEYYSKLN